MTHINRRLTLAGIASLAASAAPGGPSAALPLSDTGRVSEVLQRLLRAYFQARDALNAAAAESDRLFALIGGDNAPDGSPAHAAYKLRRAAVGYDAAMEWEDELYDARCDAEDAVYRFAPASLADVEAKARVLIAHNELKEMDFGVEAFIRSLLREAA